MKTNATVISTDGEFALVEVVRLSACEGCHKAESGSCSVCSLTSGGIKKTTVRAQNTLGAAVGEKVVVESSSRRILLYAAVLFLLPIFLFAAGFGVSSLFTATLWIRVLAGFCGMVIAFVGVAVFEKTVAAKRCDVEIVARLYHPLSEENETNG